MPDIDMCASTVCSVRKDCLRNWDSGSYRPDRDPKVQKWVPNMLGVSYGKHAQPEDCTWYKPLHHFPKDELESSWATIA